MKKLLISMFAVIVLCANSSLAQNYKKEEVSIGDFKKYIYYNEVIIVNDDSSPVQIQKASVKHIPKEVSDLVEAEIDSADYEFRNLRRYLYRDILNEKLVINVDASGDDAVAVQFGIVVYDAFKEFLGGFTAVTMEAPEKEMEWDFSPPYLFKFKKYGVLAVYVKQVRLESGEIWDFDVTRTANMLSREYSAVTEEQILEDIE